MSKQEDQTSITSVGSENSHPVTTVKTKWYRNTWFNITIVGLCNLAAPGLWGATNSLGGGGTADAGVVNAANAITFCLMWLVALFGSGIVKLIGVRNSLALGGMGYAPYSAALYCNVKYGTTWFIYLGSALCGLSAGLFWGVEAAITISYPEPYRKGKLMSYWLCYRVSGQLIGGAINLGVNAKRTGVGSVSPNVYIVFIALQALGPFVAYLLSPPEKVERSDGQKVKLYADQSFWGEFKNTLKEYAKPDFLLIVPFLAGTVWSEATNNTYIATYFTVRARALGSFLSAVTCMLAGFIEGSVLDLKFLNNKTKKRYVFVTLAVLQAGIWVWSTINSQDYRDKPTFDWSSPGFGRAFGVYIFLAIGFQLNYLFCFHLIGDFASKPAQIIRLASLIRGNESAAQAISYGLASVKSLATVGISAINFGVWGISIPPAAYVIWRVTKENYLNDRDEYDPGVVDQSLSESDTSASTTQKA